ncbi:hypothetical protein Clacol_005020 [Clathrus columnatus]|uniref:Uncharacterized protein n=1 Tax=Clathrus columnatus TaxID=1419009 RepID=A0AAV5AAS0_9AGAM|nr:hypothetical protein Clacol_005020 [Clathrus columnatus]
MQSLMKFSIILYLITLGAYVSSQTTTSLYIPGIPNSGGEKSGDVVFVSVGDSKDGTSTFVLALGSTPTSAGAVTPTLTLVAASATAHLFGDIPGDSGTTVKVDTQCTIKGDVSTCTEVDTDETKDTTTVALSSSFTESPSPVAATVVTALPTPPAPTPAPSPVPTSPTNGSNTNPSPSPTPTKGSGAMGYHTVSVLLCAFPVAAAVFSMML